ncbi:hypothetical protein GCM10027175_07740 [Hymenobacter latericoloratus]
MKRILPPLQQRNGVAAPAQVQRRAQSAQASANNDNVQLISSAKKVEKKIKARPLSKISYILAQVAKTPVTFVNLNPCLSFIRIPLRRNSVPPTTLYDETLTLFRLLRFACLRAPARAAIGGGPAHGAPARARGTPGRRGKSIAGIS